MKLFITSICLKFDNGWKKNCVRLGNKSHGGIYFVTSTA